MTDVVLVKLRLYGKYDSQFCLIWQMLRLQSYHVDVFFQNSKVLLQSLNWNRYDIFVYICIKKLYYDMKCYQLAKNLEINIFYRKQTQIFRHCLAKQKGDARK